MGRPCRCQGGGFAPLPVGLGAGDARRKASQQIVVRHNPAASLLVLNAVPQRDGKASPELCRLRLGVHWCDVSVWMIDNRLRDPPCGVEVEENVAAAMEPADKEI